MYHSMSVFTVLATSEEQARVKIDNLLEIMRDEATVDCHVHPSYDVYIDDVKVSNIPRQNTFQAIRF